MRALLVSAISLVLPVLSVAPAVAQTEGSVLDRAARALPSDPVYIDPSAERAGEVRDAEARLEQRIRDRGVPLFIAILPRSAVDEAGGNVNEVPRAVASKVDLSGTYGVVAGNSFRGASNTLPQGRAGSLATSAFQTHSGEGTEAVLADFIDRVAAIDRNEATGPARTPFDNGESSSSSDGEGGGSSALPLLLLLGAGGAGLYFWQRGKKTRQEAAIEHQADRSLLQAELSVLAQDVMELDPQIALHPEARADYDAGVARYRVAQAALERADDRIDLVRVERVLDEGRYAMERARAIVQGREPPPPPADLTRPGRHDEPPVDLDERGQPAYVGYGSPFYGGGWFGGGGGLLTGMFLGQMLGGGFGWGGGHHEQNVYVEDSGGDGGGGEWGGGDWGGGDVGGGDWGGGGFGDMGGGDWG